MAENAARNVARPSNALDVTDIDLQDQSPADFVSPPVKRARAAIEC